MATKITSHDLKKKRLTEKKFRENDATIFLIRSRYKFLLIHLLFIFVF